MVGLTLCSLLVGLILGCDTQDNVTQDNVVELSLSYRQRMRQSASDGDWDSAWADSDQVLIEAGGEPATLQLVAEVAFKTGRKSLAADLLVEAARVQTMLAR